MGLVHKKDSSVRIYKAFVLIFVSLTIVFILQEKGTLRDWSWSMNDLFYSENYTSDAKRNQLSSYGDVNTKQSNITDSISLFKNLAFSYAEENNAELASVYIEKYVQKSLDVKFVGNSNFDKIANSESYQDLSDKYLKNVDLWSLFCLYVGFIGVFMFTLLNFNISQDRLANFLMSVFLIMHSFFIIRVSLLLANYDYYLPHVLYLPVSFSLLYGPVIYFYFKRVTTKYKFRIIDALHIVPTIILMVLLIPVYNLSSEEKLDMMIHNERPYMALILIGKLISLIIYGTFIIKMHINSVKNNLYLSKREYVCMRNIVIFHSFYIVSYAIYAIFIVQNIGSGFLFKTQIVSMALLIMYISYNTFVQLYISVNRIKLKEDKPIIRLDKYKNSNLTKSLSLELKERLLNLLDNEKVYKQNDITLQKLAEMLDTTRHNTSQIINEHFELNFFELINTYRIEEAKELLKDWKDTKINIIDVAYEVGFNNKVTFNKSFKRFSQSTPSEYMKSNCA